MICYLLEAVLGVNDTELKKDFDMSAFSLCAPTSSVYRGLCPDGADLRERQQHAGARGGLPDRYLRRAGR